MLAKLRTHATSWIIKLMLSIIILSFVLFFGYNRIRRVPGRGAVASVNGELIYNSQYRRVYENMYRFYRDLYQAQEIPKNILTGIREGALRQLIHNKLLSQMAQEIGLKVTDQELTKAIITNPLFNKNGKFDVDFYKKIYLPYFRNKYNLNYEDLLREELLVEKLKGFIRSSQKASQPEIEQYTLAKNTKWTFEIVEIDGDSLIKDGRFSNIDEVAKLATNIQQQLNSYKVGRLLRRYKLKRKRIEASIDNIAELEPIPFSDKLKIFALNKEKKLLDRPLRQANKFYAIKFVEKTTAPNKEETEQTLRDIKAAQFLESWLAQKASRSTIRIHLPSQE